MLEHRLKIKKCPETWDILIVNWPNQDIYYSRSGHFFNSCPKISFRFFCLNIEKITKFVVNTVQFFVLITNANPGTFNFPYWELKIIIFQHIKDRFGFKSIIYIIQISSELKWIPQKLFITMHFFISMKNYYMYSLDVFKLMNFQIVWKLA